MVYYSTRQRASRVSPGAVTPRALCASRILAQTPLHTGRRSEVLCTRPMREARHSPSMTTRTAAIDSYYELLVGIPSTVELIKND